MNTSEMDKRAALAAAPAGSWLDQVDRHDDDGHPDATQAPVHPGVGVAVLACRCGRAIDAADMRRLVPARDTASASTVIRPIVCPDCSLAARP